MIGEFVNGGRVGSGQDRALARYVRDHVAPFSDFHRASLRDHTVTNRAELAALPVTSPHEVADADLVLRPSADTLPLSGDRELRLRWAWARARRRAGTFNRTILEPRYKPIHWLREELPAGDGTAALRLGYSAEDLDRLSDIGRSALEMAGVVTADVLVSLVPQGPTLAFWQLHLGARSAGVPALWLWPDAAADEVARLRPTVLAGRSGDLIRLLEAGRGAGYSFAGLSTLLVVGEPLDPARRRQLADTAESASGPVAVVAMWAPPGVRAMWSECRDGVDAHTWPAHEVVELVDPLSDGSIPAGAEGEVVWTPLGWKGSVVLRLRTGVYGCIDDSQCVSCGRSSPRLRVVSSLPPFARILDEHPGIGQWQAELRTHGGAEELIVFLSPAARGHPGRLLRELDRQLSVTQFVVLDRRAMDERLRTMGDARVFDLRS